MPRLAAATLRAERPEEDSEAAVVTKAVARVAERLGLTNRELARILGLSEASVSRLRRGTFRLDPGSKAFELALLLVRLFRALDAITGGEEPVARAWLRNPNTALGGVPLEMIASVGGLVDVLAYLDARRAVL